MVSQYIGLAVWLVIVCALSAYGLDLLYVFGVGLVTGLGFGWLLAPSRGWWGPGPSQVMADPAALRRYRKHTLVFFVAALVIVPFAVVVAGGALGLGPN